MTAQTRQWGHRFCGAFLEGPYADPHEGGERWFWIGWHDLERAEGQTKGKPDAVAALDHFLAGRRGAGRSLARLAEDLAG